MTLELIGIILYVGLMVVTGTVLARRIKSDEDYFLAGRSLGPWLATFSIFATWFGAESCLGTSGKIYRMGLSGMYADPLGYSLCILLLGLVFARTVWQKKITTVADLFGERFGERARFCVALVLIPSSLVWAGAQVRAFGQILHSAAEVSVVVAILLASVVVMVYTMSGGLLADAYTDLVQGTALIVGLIVIAVAIWLNHDVSTQLSSLEPWKFDLFANPEKLSPLERAELWLVPILGSLVSQELVGRVCASRSAEVARASALRAAAMYLSLGLLPVFVGLLGSAQFQLGDNSDAILPVIAKQYLNSFFYVIFIGALVSAILSTVDSTLLAISALVTHNLIYPYRPRMDEKHKVRLARGLVLASGVIAMGIALSSESITELVELASGLGGPTVLVLVSFGLFTRWGGESELLFALFVSVFGWAVLHALAFPAPVVGTVLLTALSFVLSCFVTRWRVQPGRG